VVPAGLAARLSRAEGTKSHGRRLEDPGRHPTAGEMAAARLRIVKHPDRSGA
jgi:hypothetical protein